MQTGGEDVDEELVVGRGLRHVDRLIVRWLAEGGDDGGVHVGHEYAPLVGGTNQYSW